MSVAFAHVATVVALMLLGSPEQKGIAFKGKVVPIDRAPGSQLADRRPVHVLGDELRIGTKAFSVARKDSKLLVAREPGGPATTPVVEGKPLSWSWTEAQEKRRVALRFERDRAGSWTYFAAEGVAFELNDVEVRIVDVDADGWYVVGVDGYSAYGSNAVCLLREELILERTRFAIERLSPDGLALAAKPSPLDGSPAQLAALTALNRLRLKNGLDACLLDAALSRGCTAHAEYLRRHGWNGATDPHDQTLGREGASEEGKAAAGRSVICGGPPEIAVDLFWRSYYHRIQIMSPSLSRVGINSSPPDLTVIDIAQASDVDPEALWSDPVFVPGDGATGIFTTASGELPKEPVPNLASRGLPLMALFRDRDPKIAGFSVKLVEISGRGERAVPVMAADPWRYRRAFGVVPERPLKRGTRYRATFSWSRDGKPATREIEFQTE